VRLRVVDVLPRLPDYVRCFALMSIPAVTTTMAIIFLRTATNGVQTTSAAPKDEQTKEAPR
jgi:hypothetical protein